MREGKKHPFAINVWRWGLLILLLVLWEIGARLKAQPRLPFLIGVST